MKLKEFSDDELRAEIKRREVEAKEALVPKLVLNPDFSELIRTCQLYIDQVNKKHSVDFHVQQCVYEEAMTALFGKDVFAWLNLNLYSL